LKGGLAVDLGSANTFDHQHKSMQFESRRFGLRQLCKSAGFL
jgi:hypothetical protein